MEAQHKFLIPLAGLLLITLYTSKTLLAHLNPFRPNPPPEDGRLGKAFTEDQFMFLHCKTIFK
jgi:hypothetical protein